MSEVRGRSLPPTDREMLLTAQEEELTLGRAVERIQEYRAHGLGQAAFVLSMWEGLEASGLTKQEKLGLITAALGGK